MKKIILYATICFITILLIINPEKSVYYTKNGLSLCSDIIIPSLFPFFVCSGLLIYSGFCNVIAKVFSPVMKPLFNINSSGAAAFILGIVSGYPLGALTACQLYKGFYLSKTEAERLLAFCNNSGPLFIMSAVGISIYHSTKIGIILYIAHILGAVSTGIVLRFYKTNDFCAPKLSIDTTQKSVPEIFSTVISNSLQSILTVCATVVFCSVVSCIFMDLLSLSSHPRAILGGLLEFVSGLGLISNLDLSLTSRLLMSAGVCAFAGVSVHLQVMSVVADSGLSLKPYIFGKIIHAFFAVVYTFIILNFVPATQTVFNAATSSTRISAGFFICSLYTVVTVLVILAFLIIRLCNKKALN